MSDNLQEGCNLTKIIMLRVENLIAASGSNEMGHSCAARMATILKN